MPYPPACCCVLFSAFLNLPLFLYCKHGGSAVKTERGHPMKKQKHSILFWEQLLAAWFLLFLNPDGIQSFFFRGREINCIWKITDTEGTSNNGGENGGCEAILKWRSKVSRVQRSKKHFAKDLHTIQLLFGKETYKIIQLFFQGGIRSIRLQTNQIDACFEVLELELSVPITL